MTKICIFFSFLKSILFQNSIFEKTFNDTKENKQINTRTY